jgi:hypothetical protein
LGYHIAQLLQIGDRVLSVNGKALARYRGEGTADPAEPFWQLLQGDQPIMLSVERTGKELAVRITPTELLPFFTVISKN